MKTTACVITLAVVALAVPVRGSIVSNHLILVQNGATVLMDHFDGGTIDPMWTPVGSVGPIHDSVIDMDPGDGLLASLKTQPDQTTIASTLYQIGAPFTDGYLTLSLGGSDGSDFLALAAGDGSVALYDETGLRSLVPLALTPTLSLTLVCLPSGGTLALANEQVVFVGFSPVNDIASVFIGYTPIFEPAGAALLCFGLVVMAAARYAGRRGVGGGFGL